MRSGSKAKLNATKLVSVVTDSVATKAVAKFTSDLDSTEARTAYTKAQQAATEALTPPRIKELNASRLQTEAQTALLQYKAEDAATKSLLDARYQGRPELYQMVKTISESRKRLGESKSAHGPERRQLEKELQRALSVLQTMKGVDAEVKQLALEDSITLERYL